MGFAFFDVKNDTQTKYICIVTIYMHGMNMGPYGIKSKLPLPVI